MMLTVQAPAKVNLTLDVLERESSGYHRIQTIFHEVPQLYDTLTFEEVDEPRVWLEPHSQNDETNTILRAAHLLQQAYGLKQKGLRIRVEKRIPMRSGLGGASSDAAATLSALNTLWDLQLPMNKLLFHAAQIGMDVPFFMFGGCALGMHYGDHLMPLPTLDTLGFTIEIIPTKKEVSTPEAYAKLDLARCGKNAKKTSALIKILKGEKAGDIESLLHNDFENSPFPENEHLAGSGGAIFKLKKRAPNKPSAPPMPGSK